MHQYNKELASIFNQMAAMYRYLGIEERFRMIAYQKAARAIASLPADITQYLRDDTIEDIPGIGEGIANKVREYIATGRIGKYEQLKDMVPHDIIDMMDISGFGPQSLKKIHQQLNIRTKGELVEALRSGSVAKLKGFGSRKVENMMRGLKLHKTLEERMLLWEALEAGEKILAGLKQLPEVKQAGLAGSVRRMKETIGDIDILVACEEKHRKKVVAGFTGSPLVQTVLAKGSTRASVVLRETGRQVDLRLVGEHEWGSALQYFTGSKEHNIHLRTIAKDMGYKISEYGIYKTEGNRRVGGKTEEEIYETLGLRLMPPEMREDKGEIELAMKGKVPRLVTLDDLRGDLQMHTTWSDGTNNIEELAHYVKSRFPYDYIALTDHSKSARVAGGLDERQILEQVEAVREVNHKLGCEFVKTGIEVDILPDGSLDIAGEVLAQLDWVTASIHSNFKKDNTDRIVRACENPYVACIGHPTGRLIGLREPYKVNMGKVIEAARHTHTALEINAQPERMDLNDEMARNAREQGVKLVISTDSHGLAQFSFMKLGIAIARRAWCTKKDILNTGSWTRVQEFVRHKREKVPEPSSFSKS